MKKQFKMESANEMAAALEVVREFANGGNRSSQRIENGLPRSPKIIDLTTLNDLGYAITDDAITCTKHVALRRVREADTGREAKFSFLACHSSGEGIVINVRQSEIWDELIEQGEVVQ